MNSLKKVVNNIKFPKSLNISLKIEGSGLLHNKAILYFIFAISFGNFMLELMTGDFYFVAVYILIGFLTSFFNKNMIVVLAMAAIFANILKYGAKSVEGLVNESHNDSNNDSHNDSHNENHMGRNEIDLDNAIPIDISHNKDSKKYSHNESDISNNSNKKKSIKESLEMSDYKESEKLLKNQELLLKNINDMKPFFDTIKGLTSSFGGNK